ncbi:ECF RNA polymerase sigma factor SigK [Dyadobacter sp. CECT 9623]|uniref:ECF RNA polymerase sigma factor SigK n=1 Tax=Dyadobacter linearis TaxID=2823330 RepID=A0ABM8UYR7_9BACT|nr:sigma-70 family RNA polymerase sigma factor [Dyadobacter sp. CECT 9623]CAG5074807.1 ECF RNA polymerase sigma factor SigK [Dyadobacter sp. CECT 9623]
MNRKSTFICENELVSLLKANDKAAFEYLYDHYAAGLFGTACRIIRDDNKVDDVMQDAFLKIWKKIACYDPDRGTLFTWMLNITRHTAIDSLRADAKFESNIDWDSVSESDLNAGATLVPLTSAIATDLKSFVDKLIPERKQLIELVYFDGYTHEEASEYLKLPLGTVKSRVRKALSELRQVFDIADNQVQAA